MRFAAAMDESIGTRGDDFLGGLKLAARRQSRTWDAGAGKAADKAGATAGKEITSAKKNIFVFLGQGSASDRCHILEGW